MDAERALRVQRVEVPRIKALAVREGPILFADGKGKPYVVDPVALKVLPFLPSLPFVLSSLRFAAVCARGAEVRLEVLAARPARTRGGGWRKRNSRALLYAICAVDPRSSPGRLFCQSSATCARTLRRNVRALGSTSGRCADRCGVGCDVVDVVPRAAHLHHAQSPDFDRDPPATKKIMLAEKKRAINPWQASTDREAATKIQALYRGHRQVGVV